MTYAQERFGMKLHLVDVVNGRPMLTALCGRTVGSWRMTINLPLGHACRNCVRVARAENPSPREYIVL